MADYSLLLRSTRSTAALAIRDEAARLAAQRPHPLHVNNGEEGAYRGPGNSLTYIANYSKALPHRRTGEVQQPAYRALLRAMYGGDPQLFEQIPVGRPSGLNLTNPQSGLAFELEGPDAQVLTQPPAPRIDQPEVSSEMAELYWMALLRDVSFIDYGTGANTDAGANTTANAVASLNNDFSDFRGPKQGGVVTPGTLFRGFPSGVLTGPYVSQFLLAGNADPALGLGPQDGFIKYGTLLIDQRQKTAQTGVDYLTRYEGFLPGAPVPSNWLAAQNGFNYSNTDVFDPNRLFMRNLRDLATYVHFDALYEAYLNACLIMLNLPVPFDPGNPYTDSINQDGFGTFGGPNILSLVTEVATRALKAVWYQKWGVHRRLRPEEFGGRIHVHLRGLPPRPFNPPVAPGRYPMIDGEILNTAGGSVLDRIRVHNQGNFGDDTFLLPLAFPEGCPTHPAYGAGHATVGSACVTILKAWFDESFVLPFAFVPNAAGTALQPVPGAPALTVRGELDKLAANIALARNGAGVHWRTDYTASTRLGEEIAIGILQEQRLLYNEDFHFTVTRFDGTAVVI